MNNEMVATNQFPKSFSQMMEHYSETLQLIKSQTTQIKQIDDRLDYIENKQPINPVIASFLQQQRKQIVIELLGGKSSPAYKNRKISGAVYREAASAFKKHFKIPRYDLLKREDQESALNFWTGWLPSESLRKQILEANKVK
ncbi:ORF6C domain-containing protein [Ruoffia sp. FAM 24228]|uniref:ORF6C domain-containing protein n=1 Tax=unclassified Ruoffia TaxID=2862149 RepID=UPI003887A1C6